MTSPAASRLARLPKPGKLAQGPVLVKVSDADGVAQAPAPTKELTVIVDAVGAALADRRTAYRPTAATVLDNATLAAQNANPRYAQLLASWGRQTGAMVAVEAPPDGEPGLLRVSVIVSRYAAPDGAQAAYRYVIEQYDTTARRLEMAPVGVRLPWDEAALYYQETQANGQRLGQYTLIFRAGALIAFVNNVGLAGQVSTRDTAQVTQALIERLGGL
ncbi:MAG: hypothetical protein IT340_05350 [Chloroflexi bacterium]|nr:hypothetical protein [Chloroflexota bacterium]